MEDLFPQLLMDDSRITLGYPKPLKWQQQISGLESHMKMERRKPLWRSEQEKGTDWKNEPAQVKKWPAVGLPAGPC